jgi:hypothetical protein
MGWDYFFELRPPTGLLVILQVIYEHGEPWWNNIDRGNWVFHQKSLTILPAESSSSKAGRTGEGNYEFGLTKYLSSHFKGVFNMP